MTEKPKLSVRRKTQAASGPSRRAAILQGAGAIAAASYARAYAQPAKPNYEVLQVGPGQRFKSITEAGVFMNSEERWNAGYSGAQRTAKTGFHVIIHPGPPGYYVNDSGSHSRRWPKMIGWPFYEGNLLGPVIIEGAPGQPPPVLETDGNGDGVIYYQTGLFSTGSCDATFRRLIFRGFRRADGIGNYAAVRLGQTFADIPMNSQVLFEDCEFSHCDNGVMGGAAGQSLTLRRCYFHENGNETGRTHNIYFSDGDVLTVEDTLSTHCTIGHLLKSRAKKTVINNTRLLGGGGTESACLDVPDAGVLEISGLTCEKSATSDASWIIHYSGENQDGGDGVPFRNPSSIQIRDLTMTGPPSLKQHPSWGPVLGFANQSGLGQSESGKGSFFVAPHAEDVKIFGLNANSAGLPCSVLPQQPALDLSSPVKL